MRVAFLGNDRWSVPSLEALVQSSNDLVLAATREPRPAGRGRALTPTPVAGAARRLGLTLAEVDTVKRGAGFDALAASRPDVLVVVAYGEILPETVLAVPSVAPVNVHFSLLPALRGAAPVQRAIFEGCTVTGITTMRMTAGLDAGPIMRQATVRIDPEEDAGTLGRRLATAGGALLVDTLDRLAGGSLDERPQDESGATFAPKIERGDRQIDWTRPPEFVLRQVRALAPEPGAATSFRDRRLKVTKATARRPGRAGPDRPQPGAVVRLDAGEFAVATSVPGELIALVEVALEGRKRMSGEEFVRGHRPKPGERLG
jgi:methionyl-tRNA formyltransferase